MALSEFNIASKAPEELGRVLVETMSGRGQVLPDAEKALALIKAGASVEERDVSGCTPIFWAANHKMFECMEALIAKGADVNARDDNGMTPLMASARAGREPDCLNALINAGAKVDDDIKGHTALAWAAQGHIECLEALIAAGANVNTAKNQEGMPVHLWTAINHWQEKCVQVLVEAGIILVDKETKTSPALDMAWNKRLFPIASILQKAVKKELKVIEEEEQRQREAAHKRFMEETDCNTGIASDMPAPKRIQPKLKRG